MTQTRTTAHRTPARQGNPPTPETPVPQGNPPTPETPARQDNPSTPETPVPQGNPPTPETPVPQGNPPEPILQVQQVSKTFRSSGVLYGKTTELKAVNNVSFDIYPGETLGLLGESGCGKSTMARMLMHLIRPTSGKILLKGTEIQQMPESRFRHMRHIIQMVYQNPFDCLDPVQKIYRQLEEPLKIWHPEMSETARSERIHAMIDSCGLPENSLQKRPREFSGGQLQRISIARSLLAQPEILIADEIVSALDVSIQNQVLQLLQQMQEQYHLTILFITHDLSVAKKVSDRVMVMQSGRIAGIGKPEEVFSDSSDPYILALEKASFVFT